MAEALPRARPRRDSGTWASGLGSEVGASPAVLPVTVFCLSASLLIGSETSASSLWLGQWFNTQLYLSVVVATLNGTAAVVSGFRVGRRARADLGDGVGADAPPRPRRLAMLLAAAGLWHVFATVVVSAIALARTGSMNS